MRRAMKFFVFSLLVVLCVGLASDAFAGGKGRRSAWDFGVERQCQADLENGQAIFARLWNAFLLIQNDPFNTVAQMEMYLAIADFINHHNQLTAEYSDQIQKARLNNDKEAKQEYSKYRSKWTQLWDDSSQVVTDSHDLFSDEPPPASGHGLDGDYAMLAALIDDVNSRAFGDNAAREEELHDIGVQAARLAEEAAEANRHDLAEKCRAIAKRFSS